MVRASDDPVQCHNMHWCDIAISPFPVTSVFRNYAYDGKTDLTS